MAADVAAMGTHILVVTDDDKPKADALAEELGMEIFSHRGNLRPPYYTIDSVRKTAHLFLSAFPMCVLSLSWQNVRFYIQMAHKCRFSQAFAAAQKIRAKDPSGT